MLNNLPAFDLLHIEIIAAAGTFIVPAAVFLGCRSTYICTRCHETKQELFLTPNACMDGGWAALSVDSGKTLLRVYTDSPVTAILACYDESGRLLSSQVIALKTGYTEQTLIFAGTSCKIFLIDETGRPLCESISYR